MPVAFRKKVYCSIKTVTNIWKKRPAIVLESHPLCRECVSITMEQITIFPIYQRLFSQEKNIDALNAHPGHLNI